MKLTSAILFALLFTTSCNHQSPSPNPELVMSTGGDNIRKNELPSFLSKFKILPNEVLKLNFDGYDTNLTKLDAGSSDTIFIPQAAMGLAYGLLPDTTKFYALLWYAGVENGALELTLLDKNGNRLDERQLGTDLYGWDCGYEWSGKVFIRKDMTILLRDSLVTYECDSAPTPESKKKHEIDSMEGMVSSKGKIIFSKIRQTKLD